MTILLGHTRPLWGDWRAKALAQGVISHLPRSTDLNRALQRRITGSLVITPEAIAKKWNQTLDLVEMWAVDGQTDFTALEIGTGWVPIAPLALRAAGASDVVTVDVQPLLRLEEVHATLLEVARALETGTLRSVNPKLADELRRALSEDHRSPEELLAACGVRALVGDIERSGVTHSSIDVSVSNNTFEHVPGPDLLRIVRALARLQADGGASVHFIDLKDHYAGFDGQISVYNFLRYSERRWRWYNNGLQYQNRLRASDYRALFADAGVDVFAELTEGDLDGLATVSRAAEFAGYSKEDAAVHSMWVGLRRPVARTD